jgi:hypothetical protein
MFMVFNSLIAANMIKNAGGWPKLGNSYGDWKAVGTSESAANPEHLK